MNTKEVVEKAKDEAKERNFEQSVDIAINLRDIDLGKPENRFSSEIILPHDKGKDLEICVIADNKLPDAQKLDVETISEDELEELEDDKSRAKKIADRNDYFLAEAPLMPDIGQILGPVLGPRGKMPKPFTPDADLKDLVQKTKKTFSVKLKENNVVHTGVGREDMDSENIAENIDAIVNLFEKNLTKGAQQVGSVYVKLTMGPPIEL